MHTMKMLNEYNTNFSNNCSIPAITHHQYQVNYAPGAGLELWANSGHSSGRLTSRPAIPRYT